MGRIVIAAIVSLWVIPISIIVNHIVPGPYMDEIFHIPQAQQYCWGNLKCWDPMITTPPGLYYLSLAHVASLFPAMFYAQAASTFSDVCSTAMLRSINGVMAVICAVLSYEIIVFLRPGLDKRKATLYSVVLALYPLHWFFTFLYYTDVASLTAVLAMYLTCLKKHYTFSALFGAFAVLIRQTNIIWVVFVACAGVINDIFLHERETEEVDNVAFKKNDWLAPNKKITAGSNIRRRKLTGVVDSAKTLRSSPATLTSGLRDEFWTILLVPWHIKLRLLVSFGPFFLVLVVFAAFVCWNGSVVLGAKEAHSVSPHFAQLLYFGLVSALAMAPLHFTTARAAGLFSVLWKNRPHSLVLGFLAFAVGFVLVHFFSLTHPYLLADNRHYTFYLWRWIIGAHCSVKYGLVPLYMYSWFSILSMLGSTGRMVWVLAYLMAVAAVLVPAPLVELRYYTVPFYLAALHSAGAGAGAGRWVLMGVAYAALNAVTMTVFLLRPFSWDHQPGIQRFIW